jgi:hypothetical protein
MMNRESSPAAVAAAGSAPANQLEIVAFGLLSPDLAIGR